MHRISDLRYILLRGAPPLAEARVLDSREVAWRGRRVTFYALAASHAVTVHGPDAITELIACGDFAPSGERLAEASAATPYKVVTRVAGIVYHCRIEPFRLGSDEALRGEFPGAQRLDVAYPGSEAERAPVTRIGWRVSPRQLAVETLHTYPEQGMGVRSDSCFECDDERA